MSENKKPIYGLKSRRASCTLDIKKQIHTLYLNSAFGAFRFAQASWVALLASRGFSLVQIGLAESVFHLTSLLFEVPSGVISDVFGRKRSMIMSHCMALLSALVMLLSESMPGILLGMMFSALGYNFESGAREALAYDSLKEAGREEDYAAYSATDLMVYRIGGCAAILCAGLALFVGYQRAYLVDIVLAAFCLVFTFRLRETEAFYKTENFTSCSKEENDESHWKKEGVLERIRTCFRESVYFLKTERRVLKPIFFNAGVGAVATLLQFFLQARLPECGLSEAALGPALFFMGMGGVAGAKLVTLFPGRSFEKAFKTASVAVCACLMISLCEIPAVMIVSGFCASMFDDFLQIRCDVKLNEMVPSGQRATLLSVSSLCFSIVMIVLSPLFGMLFSL